MDKKKIMIIDDETQIVQLLKVRLEINGYDVVAFHDGKSGLEYVKETEPDLILLDLLMPIMDGYTFVRELDKMGSNISVIILSAKGNLKDVFKEKCVVDYIVKPFIAEDLLVKVAKHI